MILLRRKYLFYTLALLSGIFTSLMVATDVWITVRVVPNPYVFALCSFMVGSIVHVLILIIATAKMNRKKFIGTVLDPNFLGFFIPKNGLLKHLILAGLGNAISTISYVYVVALTQDPSSVLPFTNLVTAYLIIGDLMIEKEKPVLIEVHAFFMIILGAILVSLSRGIINLAGLALVLGPMNLGTFLYVYEQKKARTIKIRGKRYDSINLRVWSLLFTTIFVIIMAPLIVGPESIVLSIVISIAHFFVIALDMLLAFFAYVLYIRALGMGKMSVVNALVSVSVVISLPLTLILAWVFPDVYILPDLSGVFGLVRIIGIIFVFLGMTALSFSEVVGYILIKSRPGSGSKLLKKLSTIKGVEYVSATAGKYDYIVRIKIRSLGKAYENVLQKIIKIEEIIDFVWISVLKEWELV